MPIISISNLKGGTGKTTTAIMLAAALHKQGKNVEVWDLDPQGSASEWAGIAADDGTPLPFPVKVVNAYGLGRIREPREKWILIDCPPGRATHIDAALKAADHVVIPVRPSSMEVTRMWETADLVEPGKASVLITSAIANTTKLRALISALTDENVQTFTTTIPQREAIKGLFGTGELDELWGYGAVASELEERI